MSFIGTLLGGVGGFLLGGPTGAMMGASLGGGIDASNAASSAANTQAAAANRAADLQYQQWREQQALQEPWRQAGVNALGKLQTAADYTPFGMQQFQQDPGYGFRMSEGLKSLDRTAASRGGLLSGATLKGAQRYGQDLASQEYQNAFNRYQTERQAKLGPLQSLAGVGQSAVNQLGAAGQSMASNVGEAYQNAANARASGYVGGANAMAGAIGNFGNYYQNQQLLNRLMPSTGAQT